MNRILHQTAVVLMLSWLSGFSGISMAQDSSDKLLVDCSECSLDYLPAIFPANLDLELKTYSQGINLDLTRVFVKNHRRLQFSSWSWSFADSVQTANEHLILPDIPRGFFCKWEDELIRKGLPIDFGTD